MTAQLDRMIAALRRGAMTRRDFVSRAAAMGISVPLASALGARAARAEAEALDRSSKDQAEAVRAHADATARSVLENAETRAAALLRDAEERTTAMVDEAEDRLARIRVERDAVAGYFEGLRGVLSQAETLSTRDE